MAESAAWTDNGMHWNEAGYQRMAILFAERCLQQDLSVPLIQIDAEQKWLKFRVAKSIR
jgi:hypothetical protein